MVAILETIKLTRSFGGLLALKELDLSLEQETIGSIIGPNGAGKTTLFNLLSGFYGPSQGQIRFLGRDIAGRRPHVIARLGMGRTFQNIRLFGNMSALDNVLVGMHSRLRSTFVGAVLGSPGTRREERRARSEAMALLDYVGLEGMEHRWASTLPYGHQRRLELARALASQPQLLLLDEPTAGMNPQESREMMGLIQRLRAERGVTILLIEHDMRVVMGISDRVTVLDYGVKIAEGPPLQIQRDPRVVEAYLGTAGPPGTQSTPSVEVV